MVEVNPAFYLGGFYLGGNASLLAIHCVPKTPTPEGMTVLNLNMVPVKPRSQIGTRENEVPPPFFVVSKPQKKNQNIKSRQSGSGTQNQIDVTLQSPPD